MEIRFLGPLRAFEEGGSVALGGPRQRLVLAQLLVHANEVVSTERLIEQVWGDTPPPAVRATLQSYVSHLRKALGAHRIESHGVGYVLRVAPEEVDGLRFAERVAEGHRLLASDPAAAAAVLRDALELWSGPPFADLDDEPSLQGEISRLGELRLAALEDRIAAELAQGHHQQLVGELQTLTAAHPLRERLWELLMLALYRSGRQAEALAAFDRTRRLLADELGIDPSPGLRRLHEQILAQDVGLEPEGQALKGYELLEQLGAGSFGAVYRAVQPHVGREVAVKVAHPHLVNDPEFIRRFEAEAQAVARLEHPHIVPLYDYWREPSGAYLVLRWLRGGSLAQAPADGPLQRKTALRYASQVAAALHAAHRRGVVHGAVKPSNVLLDEEGNAYLSDFGIVVDRVRAWGGPPGSPRSAHSPPRGQPTVSGDLSALGALLHEALTGSPLHRGGPSTALPEDVRQVISRATAVEAGERYGSAAELAAALSGLLEDGPPRTVATSPSRDGTPNPYKGLRPFGEADAADFAGREVLVNRLVSRLAEEGPAARFLLVVGPSGSGKSSVVRAGLVPALREDAVPGSSAWFVTTMHPGPRPAAALEAALLRVAVTGDVTPPRTGEDGLTEAVRRALPDEHLELLLVVDQLEEVFTLCHDEEERSSFLAGLADAVRHPSSRLRLVATLRADFYDRPLEHPAFADLMRTRTETVVPLTPGEIKRAITVPAARTAVSVEPELVARIVADVNGQPGSLPLLQYALTELFDRRQDDTLTLEAYEAVGGVAGALAGRADQTYELLPATAQSAARQLFLRLVTLGEGGAGTRRRALLSELLTIGSEAGGMREAVDAFGASRLLSFDRDPATRQAQVEIAHEALLARWHRLRGWVEAARDDVRLLARLQAAAREWTDAGQDPSFLLRGARLERIEAWARTGAVGLSGTEAPYLEASVAEREREAAADQALREHEAALERRAVARLRAFVVVLTLAALVAGGLTLVASTQARRATQQTRVATARGLAAASAATLEDDPERSILLALEAVAATRDADGTVLPEAEEALHRAVSASRVVLRVPDIGGNLSWSPEGGLFVTEGPEDSGVIDLRDDDTGESVRSFHGHDVDVNEVAFSPDGTVLVSVGDDGAARAWDPATGEARWAVESHDEVWGPAFSPDGSALAAAWLQEGTVRVIDVATGEVTSRLGPLGLPRDTSFSRDGALLAVAELDKPDPVVWDLSTGAVAHTLAGHDDPVLDLDHSPDGRWVATASLDGTLRIFETDSGDLRSSLPSDTTALGWSPDSTRLVTGATDGVVRVWDVSGEGTPRQHLALSAEPIGIAVGVAFSPDGTRVMAGDIVIAGVQVWDVTVAGTAEWAAFPTQADAFNAVAFTSDGRRVVASSDQGVPRPDVGSATVWDLATGEEIRRTADQQGPVFRIDVTPEGGLVAAASEESVRVVDAATGAEAFTFAPEGGISDIVWDPDGDVLAVSSWEGTVTIVDRRGIVVEELEAGSDLAVGNVSFSPDGRHLAAAILEAGPRLQPSVRRVRIWDRQRAEIVREIPTLLEYVVYDPTGTRLATMHPSGDIHLWDAASGERAGTLAGHRGPVSSLAFDGDGSRLVSGGEDGTVRLWDLSSAVQLLSLPGHGRAVTDVAFSPDGSRLASAGRDGTVRVWALDLDDLIQIARRELTRGLTDDECRQYLHRPSCEA